MTLAILTDTWQRCTACTDCDRSCECKACHMPARLPRSIHTAGGELDPPPDGATGQRIGPDGERT